MLIRKFVLLCFLISPNFIFAQLEYDIEDGYVKIYDYLDAFDLLDTVGNDGIRRCIVLVFK